MQVKPEQLRAAKLNAVNTAFPSCEDATCGLTKREELAARNMAALMGSCTHLLNVDGDMRIGTLAHAAVVAADVLLLELEKTK